MFSPVTFILRHVGPGCRVSALLLLMLILAACNFELNVQPPGGKAGLKKSARDHPVRRGHKGAVWDESFVHWEDYTEGMQRALREDKPVLLVIETDWCGYCKAYSWSFLEDEVEELSRDMVMIRVDADDQPGAARLHAPTGSGVPRTFIFPAGGFLALSRGARHPKPLRVDFDYADPLIQAMRAEIKFDDEEPASGLSGLARTMAEKVGVGDSTSGKAGKRQATVTANSRVLCIIDGKPVPMNKKDCTSDSWVPIR
ncbi:MAG: thioredoxin family protein [Deltaproteobacteria bacterium]|nr:thioredoxin family protein [Deltaproteobacteria bacterium]